MTNSVNAILSKHWNGSVPVDPIMIAKRLGADVYASPSLDSEGQLFFEDNKPIIVYRPSGNDGRDRFTIAHEVGHLVLNHGPSLRDTNMDNIGVTNFDVKERDANQFAAELLMPEEKIRSAINQGITSFRPLCNHFGVSSSAMCIRLENLGIF